MGGELSEAGLGGGGLLFTVSGPALGVYWVVGRVCGLFVGCSPLVRHMVMRWICP